MGVGESGTERKRERLLSAERARSDRPVVLADAVRRVRAEFLEMPGLSLTAAQAARLWAFDAALCDEVLAALLDTRFLVRSHGLFVRPCGG